MEQNTKIENSPTYREHSLTSRLLCLLLLSVPAGLLVYIYAGLAAYQKYSLWVDIALTIAAVFCGSIVVAALSRRLRFLFGAESTRFYGWGAVVMFTAIVLFYSAEKWRGKRMWARVQAEMAADVVRVNPAPVVPDSEDMAKAPIFLPLSRWRAPGEPVYDLISSGLEHLTNITVSRDWLSSFPPLKDDEAPWIHQGHTHEQEILKYLRHNKPKAVKGALPGTFEGAMMTCVEPFSADLDSIRIATERPHANFKTRDSRFHHWVLKNIRQVFTLRAEAELRMGRTAEALADIRCALRLARYRYQDLLTEDTTRIDETVAALQPIWEGLSARQWSDEQLTVLQQELAKTRPLDGHQAWAHLMAQWNMDVVNQLFPINPVSRNPDWSDDNEPGALKWLRLVYPMGWAYEDQVDLYHRCSKLSKLVDAQNRRAFPELGKQKLPSESTDFLYVSMRQSFVDEVYPWMALWSSWAQTSVDMAQVACALERYRLAEGKFPETLQALVPGFIEKVPIDLLDGKPLRYRVDPDGRFVLYSIGWNQIDDRGVTSTNSFNGATPTDPRQGDWVWRYVEVKASEEQTLHR